MKTTEVDVKEYGYEKPVLMRAPSNKAWRPYVQAISKDPESDQAQRATLDLLSYCITEAPFKTDPESLDELDMRLVLELGLAIRGMMDPLLEKVRRQTGSDSSRPTSQAGPTDRS